jgi:sensor c-di-GMP phosphodiesterase-like protein
LPSAHTVGDTLLRSVAERLQSALSLERLDLEVQLEFLRQHNCDEFQGYLFSKPVPAEQLEKLRGEVRSELRTSALASVQHTPSMHELFVRGKAKTD